MEGRAGLPIILRINSRLGKARSPPPWTDELSAGHPKRTGAGFCPIPREAAGVEAEAPAQAGVGAAAREAQEMATAAAEPAVPDREFPAVAAVAALHKSSATRAEPEV